jgi:hypothetical protein
MPPVPLQECHSGLCMPRLAAPRTWLPTVNSSCLLMFACHVCLRWLLLGHDGAWWWDILPMEGGSCRVSLYAGILAACSFGRCAA